MGELFRSEEIQLIQLFIQFDAAHDTVDELGQIARVQFRDVKNFFFHILSFKCLTFFIKFFFH